MLTAEFKQYEDELNSIQSISEYNAFAKTNLFKKYEKLLNEYYSIDDSAADDSQGLSYPTGIF
jgi:hypothetical protein